jgi:hypothetical protein
MPDPEELPGSKDRPAGSAEEGIATLGLGEGVTSVLPGEMNVARVVLSPRLPLQPFASNPVVCHLLHILPLLAYSLQSKR